MYKKHPVFKEADDKNIKIWRYMDFTEFVLLLDKNALFFSRADRLSDPFEGSYSKANIELRPIVYRDVQEIVGQLSTFSQHIRKFTLINSWHINEHESAAMWKLHLKSDEGVAIQSTFERLTKSFDNYLEDDVYIGEVNYIDYEREWLPEGNFFYPFLHKRKSFEHERELRAIISKIPVKDGKLNMGEEIFDAGSYIPVNLDMLIEKIFIAPTAAQWFSDLVKSIVNKYNFKKEIVKSNLVNGPVF